MRYLLLILTTLLLITACRQKQTLSPGTQPITMSTKQQNIETVKHFLALLEQESAAFDLLLTDIVMPGLDGIELSYRARKLFPDIKVLYISGFTGTDGADPKSAMLSKPFHLSQLIMHVERLLQT